MTHDSFHPDTLAVNRFSELMQKRMSRPDRRKDWDSDACSDHVLARDLLDCMSNGNPDTFVDIANCCMMLHRRGADPSILADSGQVGMNPKDIQVKGDVKGARVEPALCMDDGSCQVAILDGTGESIAIMPVTAREDKGVSSRGMAESVASLIGFALREMDIKKAVTLDTEDEGIVYRYLDRSLKELGSYRLNVSRQDAINLAYGEMSLDKPVHCIQEICDDRVLAFCNLVPGEKLVEWIENPETETEISKKDNEKASTLDMDIW